MESQLVRTANEQPLIVVFAEGADGEKLEELQEAGVVLWEYDNVEELMQRIGAEKIDSVLVESGGTLSESLLMKGLVDEVMAFVAPKIIGGKTAKTPVEGEGIELMNEAIKLKNRIVEQIGEDILISGLCSQE
jgi:diaminohydroxyphosphoribosylaminopyrimidine deaminase/5-amino-6-(5-phosphoribosylamino)uracil reductase